MGKPMPKPTCGELFRVFEDACDSLWLLHPDQIPHGQVRIADRALGHMRGQAEKVYLETCPAFMIRIGGDWWNWALRAMEWVCAHYALTLVPVKALHELWGCQNPSVGKHIERMAEMPPDTALWHSLRARLCGIPKYAMDTAYHKRKGYRTRCEPSPASIRYDCTTLTEAQIAAATGEAP